MKKGNIVSVSRHRKKGTLTSMVALGAAALAGVSILATTGNSASAETLTLQPGSPDSETVITDLVTKCDNRQPELVCTWGDTKAELGPTEVEIIKFAGDASKIVNCGDDFLRQSVKWSHVKGHSVKIGGGFGAEFQLKALIADLENKLDFSVSGEWKTDKNFSETTEMEVPAGETGWITISDETVIGVGTLTVQAGDNTYIIPEVAVTAPKKDGFTSVATHTRKHTASDKAICDEAPAPPTGDGATGGVAGPGDDLPTP